MEIISDTIIGGRKFNQHNFFEDYDINLNKAIIINLQKQIEARDLAIFNSSWRKNKGYYVKDIQPRTIITKYGPVRYERRRYKYWDDSKRKYYYIFLVDKELQVNNLERISIHLKIKILEQIATGCRQRDILKLYESSGISKMSISNIIRQFDFANLYDSTDFQYKKLTIKNNLYIWVDETFVRLRNKEHKIVNYRFRLVTFHTGHKDKKQISDRNALQNKRIFCIVKQAKESINTQDFADQVYAMASKFYDNVEKAKIIVGGDGAQWIEETASLIQGHYVLDLFHATRNLHWVLKRKQNSTYQKLFKQACGLLRKGQYEQLIQFINNCSIYMLKSEHKEKIVALINYFSNKKNGIINQGKLWNIGVNAEGQISHTIKWLLSFGAKTFNIKTFQNMLHVQIANINGINPVDLLRTEITEERQSNYHFFRENNWKSVKGINIYYKQAKLFENKSKSERMLTRQSYNDELGRYYD